MEREKRIIGISKFGIVINVSLVLFKLIIGFIAGSISVVLDAFNNLSDVISSVITIIGTKLSSKSPDKEHPYGHGRIEYITTIIISLLVLVVGVSCLFESIKKIFIPIMPNFDIISIIFIVIAIFTKIFWGNYLKREGKRLDSGSLIASGIDSISDSVISLSTLVSAIISIVFHISIEGFIGLFISIIIIRSAFNILVETLNEVIGKGSSKLSNKLTKYILKYDNVLEVHDLSLHNYGPNNIIGSAYILVPSKMLAKDIHKLTQNISYDISKKFNVNMTIGIYASPDGEKITKMYTYLKRIIKKYESVNGIHGFYVDKNQKTISFDLSFKPSEDNIDDIVLEIKNKLKNKYEDYDSIIVSEKDFN